MRKGDFLWGAALLGIVAFLAAPPTHEIFVAVGAASPYLMGFAKFAVLATMGELLSIRIVAGDWSKPKGLLWRAAAWGITGVLITLMFPVFDAGVRGAMSLGYLPVIGLEGSMVRLFATAFLTSFLMNAFSPRSA